MTLLEQLQSHRGCLLRLKTEIFWHGGRGHDNFPGRVCLLLDASDGDGALVVGSTTTACAPRAGLLLIDGQPQWIWVAENDIEVIDETR